MGRSSELGERGATLGAVADGAHVAHLIGITCHLSTVSPAASVSQDAG